MDCCQGQGVDKVTALQSVLLHTRRSLALKPPYPSPTPQLHSLPSLISIPTLTASLCPIRRRKSCQLGLTYYWDDVNTLKSFGRKGIMGWNFIDE